MRFPRLAHRSAAAHKLHSTPQQDRMNLISGKGETSSRLPAFSLFLPGSCPNYRDRRTLVALDQNSTIIAVVEMSQSSWLVGGILPGIERQPRKKLEPSSERLLALLHRWRDESVRAGHTITRIAVAFEAGRDGVWLARWLGRRVGSRRT